MGLDAGGLTTEQIEEIQQQGDDPGHQPQAPAPADGAPDPNPSPQKKIKN